MRRSTTRLAWAVVVVSSLCGGSAVAHDLGIAKVELKQIGTADYLVEAPFSPSDVPPPPGFPERFSVSELSPAAISGRAAEVFSWRAIADAPLETTDQIVLPWARDGAFVSATWSDGTATSRFFPLETTGTVVRVGELGGEAPALAKTALRYTILGFEHILLGWDHLAFVLAFFLLSTGKGLVRLVTGFTLGHSMTLVAAVLGWVSVPSPPVEAAISLSIVLVAAQCLSRQPSLHHGFWVVFGFGLLHGLGFAGVLAEVGLPRSELLPGLLFFNVGVELGQLAFVLVLGIFAACLRRASLRLERAPPQLLRPTIAFGLVVLGGYWTVARIASFTG